MPAAFIVSIALILAVDLPVCREYARRISAPAASMSGISGVSEHVKAITEPGDFIWAPGAATFLYAETGRLSPTKYQYTCPHVFADTWKSTRVRKMDRVRNDILEKPPKVIVLRENEGDLLAALGLAGWHSANYETRVVTESGRNFAIAEYKYPR